LRFTSLVIAALLVGVSAWYVVRALRGTGPLLCDAARDPEAYTDEWFYRLYEGPDGWLFRQDDLQEDFALDAQTLGYLMRFNEALWEEGVTLVLAALPPRGLALPPLDHPYSPDEASRNYQQANAQLREAGIVAPNLAPLVQDAEPLFFFKRDHHWRPEGARRTARAVAEALGSQGADAYRTERVGWLAQKGSYGEAAERICGTEVPPERFPHFQTERVGETEGELFGDHPAPPVALLGTSNSRREDLNFAGFLEEETGWEVLNASAVGGGPTTAVGSFFRSQTYRAAKPRVVVWEFAGLFDVPKDPPFYRQLIPSVVGACSVGESLEQATQEVTGREVPLLRVPNGVRVEGEDFLYFEASDLSLVNFEVVLRYRDGREETLRIERPTVLPNDGRFFLEVSGDAPLAEVALRVPQGTTGSVQARLCPSP